MILSRANGTSKSFTSAELAGTLVNLELSNNQHFTADDIAFVRLSATRLLLMDTLGLHARRALEQYTFHFDNTMPHDLRLHSGNLEFNLNDGLDAIGFSALTPVAALANVNMALFTSAASEQYLAQTDLVKTQGNLGVAPAELKALAAGNNMVITSDENTVTLESQGDPVVYGATSDVDDPLFGLNAGTLNAEHNHALQFVSPLSVVHKNLGAGTVAGVSHPDVKLTRVTVDVYSKTEADDRFAPIGSSFTLQDVLDKIFTGAGVVADRSIPGQVTLGGPDLSSVTQNVLDNIQIATGDLAPNVSIDRSVPGRILLARQFNYQWPTGTEFHFGPGLDGMSYLDVFNFYQNPVQGLILDTGTIPSEFCLEFEMKPTITSGYYYIASIHDGTSRHGVEFYHDFRYSPVKSHLSSSYPGGGSASWTQSYPTNSFTKIKFKKESTGVSLFVDDVLKGSLSTGQYDPTKMTLAKIASYGGGPPHFNGYIRNLRMYQL